MFLPGSSAMTFTSVRSSTWTCAVEPACASASPFAKLAPTTGMVASSGASVPTISPSRSGVLPWLKMTTADAPAAWALSALTANVHVPRWMSAILPAGNPAKSAASHPARARPRGSQVDVHGR